MFIKFIKFSDDGSAYQTVNIGVSELQSNTCLTGKLDARLLARMPSYTIKMILNIIGSNLHLEIPQLVSDES